MSHTTIERSESYWQLVWRKFKKNKIGILGSLMVIMLAMIAVFPDFFSAYNPININMPHAYYPPQRIRFFREGRFIGPFTYGFRQEFDFATGLSKWLPDTEKPFKIRFLSRGSSYKILGLIPSNLHLYTTNAGAGEYFYVIGTDKLGRDMWARICGGARISLSMALMVTIFSIIIGVTLGIISGYYGGMIDNLLQRFVEFIMSFPQLPLWMALAAIVPRGVSQMIVFIFMSLIFAALSWPALSREIRGKVMSMRNLDYVLAAREMGASDARIIFYHLFPNNFSHIIVVTTMSIPGIILAESFLSYLGIGIQEPMVSWGLLMRDAQTIDTLGSHMWLMTPVIYILITVLGFNFAGDGLRDAADPYSKH